MPTTTSLLLLASFLVASTASDPCIFPTKYQGHTLDGCTTKDHHEAWCQTRDSWRACTADDNACEFPFNYDSTDYWECTTAGHDAPWCKKAGGGWKNCDGQAATPPSSGSFGTKSGSGGWVADHNHFRAKHGAGKVTWDSDLASKAQKWANTLSSKQSMFHSDCYNVWPPSGENLAYGYGSCSAATGDGGPQLYGDSYDQHCAVASWYGEYYLWKGAGNWQNVAGLGHFTAMVWKGVDTIGCASAGNYYVCEYGSRHCKGHSGFGGSSCWGTNPSHLPNFNMDKCSGGKCVGDLFSLSDMDEVFGNEPASGMARVSAVFAMIAMFATGAALIVRRVRSHVTNGSVRLQHDGDEELCAPEALTGQEMSEE